MKLYLDNQNAINLAKNPVFHHKSKHIETKFHFLREEVNKGKLELPHCKFENQVANILTKSLKSGRF